MSKQEEVVITFEYNKAILKNDTDAFVAKVKLKTTPSDSLVTRLKEVFRFRFADDFKKWFQNNGPGHIEYVLQKYNPKLDAHGYPMLPDPKYTMVFSKGSDATILSIQLSGVDTLNLVSMGVLSEDFLKDLEEKLPN